MQTNHHWNLESQSITHVIKQLHSLWTHTHIIYDNGSSDVNRKFTGAATSIKRGGERKTPVVVGSLSSKGTHGLLLLGNSRSYSMTSCGEVCESNMDRFAVLRESLTPQTWQPCRFAKYAPVSRQIVPCQGIP